jgi:DNA-binding CsgD family transcriptional regulator
VPLVFALVGDLVGSRRVTSRANVQMALDSALTTTSHLVPPVDRLEATVGDEFQGVYASFSAATLAALVVRLCLTGTVDVRCGIGAGGREVFAAHRRPMLQDGPVWWSARAALDTLGAPSNRLRRTCYDGQNAGGLGPPSPFANAYLTTRDALVDRLNERARGMLLLALEGHSQRDIANVEGVSESAVSQAFARGVGAVRDAQQMLTTLDVDLLNDGLSLS